MIEEEWYKYETYRQLLLVADRLGDDDLTWDRWFTVAVLFECAVTIWTLCRDNSNDHLRFPFLDSVKAGKEM